MSKVDRLEPGDHACLTFNDAEERFDILAAFVSGGLALGERIACYTDAPRVDDLRAELRHRGVPARETVPPLERDR